MHHDTSAGEVLCSPARRVKIERAIGPGDDAILITQDDSPAVVLRTPDELRAVGDALRDVADCVEAERRPAYRVPHDVRPGDRVYLALPGPDGEPVGVLDGIDRAGTVSRVWHEVGIGYARAVGVQVKGGMFAERGEYYDRLDDADHPYTGHFVRRRPSGTSGSVIITTQ